ncbi:MAG: MFS transporter [Rhodothermales bacterium]
MVFAASSQVIIISPILLPIGEALDIPEALLGTLIPAYSILLGIFAIITGPISDKVGRRRILLAGTAFMAAALYLHGIANDYVSFLIVRGLAGIAGGMLSGAAVAFVGDYFPYERRGWANGWVMSGIAFGQIVGIPLGIFLAEQFNFRWPFLAFAIAMTFAVVLIWFFVPQPDVKLDDQRLTIGRALRNYGHLLAHWRTASASVAFFLMFLSMGLYIVYLPTWLQEDIGATGESIAAMFLLGGIVNVFTGPLAGRLSDTIGRKPLVVTSCFAFGLIMVATTFVVTEVWVAYVLFPLAMITIAMRISPFQALLTALVPDERRGILMSLSVAIGQVGFGMGGALAGLLYTGYGYLSNTILGAAAIIIMAAIVQIGIAEPPRRTSTPAVATAPILEE